MSTLSTMYMRIYTYLHCFTTPFLVLPSHFLSEKHTVAKDQFLSKKSMEFDFVNCAFWGKTGCISMNFVKIEIFKMWILRKMRFQKCEFCRNWDFQNVNFVKMRLQKCQFCDKWGISKCDIFRKNYEFLPQCDRYSKVCDCEKDPVLHMLLTLPPSPLSACHDLLSRCTFDAH